jgi:hypothetical protein
MYKFIFFHDYYNEKSEYKKVEMYHERKDYFSLANNNHFDYLLIINLNNPIGKNFVKEEGHV